MALSLAGDDGLNAQARGVLADRFPVVTSTLAPVAAAVREASRGRGALSARGPVGPPSAERPFDAPSAPTRPRGRRRRRPSARSRAGRDGRRGARQLAAVEHEVGPASSSPGTSASLRASGRRTGWRSTASSAGTPHEAPPASPRAAARAGRAGPALRRGPARQREAAAAVGQQQRDRTGQQRLDRPRSARVSSGSACRLRARVEEHHRGGRSAGGPSAHTGA
jgi:hypothetical protein